MTIPIIPGPFSFLAKAGEAAGATGNALIAKRKIDRDEAEHRVNTVLSLIQAGRLGPEALNSPGALRDLRTLGVSLPFGDNETANPQTLGDIGNAGVANVTRQPFQATPADLINQMRTKALATLTPDSAAGRAITQIPSEPVAGAAEATTIAGGIKAGNEARASGPQADLAITSADVHGQVLKGALGTFGGDPQFARLAEEAALGVLPVRLSQMENNRYFAGFGRQAEQDRTRLLLDMLNDATTMFQGRRQQWQKGLQDAFSNVQLEYGNTRTDEEKQKIVNRVMIEYKRSAGEEPTFDAVRDEYLKSFGTTPDAFQSALKQIAPSLTPKAAGKPVAGEKKGLDRGQVEKLAGFFVSPPPNDKTQKPYTAEELVALLGSYKMSKSDIAAIYLAAKRLGADPATIRALASIALQGKANE